VLGPGRRGPETLVGGKAAGLQRLAGLGLPVPPWITITSRAADIVLGPERSKLELAVTGECEEGKIEQIVRATPWPRRLESQLDRCLASLNGKRRLAVRSSVVGEDSSHASHAGQFVTLLDVEMADVADAIRTCWLSAFAARPIKYQKARGVAGEWPRIAVVVQEMVQSDVAGVAFTADPRTGAPAHVVVAGYGLGSGIVGDFVETDQFTRQRGSEHWHQRIAHKASAARSLTGSHEPILVPVAKEMRDRPALSREELERLATLLDRLDGTSSTPQDVEWALDRNEHFLILQTRPLTALPTGAVTIWDDSNIGENFPGLTLPLTASYVRWLYSRLFRKALAEVGVPSRNLAALSTALAGLLVPIRGRLYMNLTNYYRLFASVPGFGWTVSSWETALGVQQGDELRGVTPSNGRRFALLGAIRTARRLLRRYRGLDGEVERFKARSDAFLNRWDRVSFAGRSASELIQVLHDLNGEFVDLWTVHIFNDLFLFVQNAALERIVGDAEIHRRVVGGIREAESLAPLMSLFALADKARALPEVDSILKGPLSPEEAWKRITALPGAARFKQQALEHLALYGDRTGEELKLETPPLRDRPWELVSLLRGCRGATSPQQVGTEEAEARLLAEQTLEARLARRPWKSAIVRMLTKQVRSGVAAREYLSLARARGFGILRRLVRAIGEDLGSRRVLCRTDDVFYLNIGELDELVGDVESNLRFRSVIAHRREAYRRFATQRVPHRLMCRGSVYRYRWCETDRTAVSNGDCLRGIPSSAGIARGPARVVAVPSPHVRTDGQILVAPATEPAWMFLMYAARGVVVERGSMLSHAAIIGRELGIPTVVGVDGATSRIRTGDTIEVNGGSGEIRILERAEV